MEMLANNSEAPWKISPGRSPSVAEIAGIVRREVARPAGIADNAILSVTSAIVPLDEAEKLNRARVDSPGWYRRVMRKQGRIDRLVRESAENLRLFLGSLPKVAGKAVLDDAKTELDAVFSIMANERGPSVCRRLRRPQSEINERLSRAVSILAGWILTPERGLLEPGEDGKKQTGVIRWHAEEAEYLSGRHRKHSPLVRRSMCDQFQINRCMIIALRKTAEIFIKV
jgi:hypothetical protein